MGQAGVQSGNITKTFLVHAAHVEGIRKKITGRYLLWIQQINTTRDMPHKTTHEVVNILLFEETENSLRFSGLIERNHPTEIRGLIPHNYPGKDIFIHSV